MLTAVLSGKRRGTGLEGGWLKLSQAEGAEDVLTASVFERLAYLPDYLFSSTLSTVLGLSIGAIETIEFWPSWYLPDGRMVEPDVVISDGPQTLLVEAKRYDYSRQQYASQLAAELQAGWREGELTEDCILLTLGGLADFGRSAHENLYREILRCLPPEQDYRFKLVCCSWQKLFCALEDVLTKYPSSGLRRMLSDISDCYSWHGLSTHRPLWLSEFKSVGLTAEPGVFDRWKIK
ncbi:TPA: F-box domain-containing protein [Pseudomonas putida]|nr:F-box domain-containing protein [Pseudomonas putida]